MLEAGNITGGRFRLIQAIGKGGMGTVWAARHERLGRDVALKLSPLSSDPERTERFLREARIIGKFHHPNIVTVLDAGELEEEDCHFLAMELLRGQPFSARFSPGRPLPPEEVLSILIDVCRGLEAAHAAGVIHRDIKPENIFLAETPAGIVPKIIDFGISKTIDATITADGQILGTPAYMSPEQAMGLRTTTAAVDIWAVGVVLYEALAGKQPFTGQNYHYVLRCIISKPPAEIPSWVDAHCRAIIERCLQKDPGARYLDVTSLRQDLELALLRSKSRASATTLSPFDDSLMPAVVNNASVDAPAPSSRSVSRMSRLLMIAAACLAIGGGAAFSMPPSGAPAAPAAPAQTALARLAHERAAQVQVAPPADPTVRPVEVREASKAEIKRPTPTTDARSRASRRPALTRVTSPGF